MCIYKPTSGPGRVTSRLALLSTRHRSRGSRELRIGYCECRSNPPPYGNCKFFSSLALSASLSLSFSKQPKTIRNKQSTRQPDAAAVVLPVLSRTELNRTETELNRRRRRFWELGNNARQKQQAEMPGKAVRN